jgi:rhodanese-related sulfurtransferase
MTTVRPTRAPRPDRRRTLPRARPGLVGVVLLAAATACGGAPSPVEPARQPTLALAAAPPPAALAFTRSPSGASEVEPDWLAAHLEAARLIDVREREELATDGRIEGSEHVPLGTLESAAADWDRDAPIVIVCRSGRRSGRAAGRLEALGFRHVASLTGGTLRWAEHGHPLVRDLPPVATQGPGPRDDALDVQWTRVASLLLGGTEACIDGRHTHAVIGTPGGDAGEFLLMLAAFEELTGRAVAAAEIDHLLSDYVAAFGRFYVHSDAEALARLGASLRRDPRFGAVPLATVADVEALVRRPPVELRAAVTEAFAAPEHVGCGHLRAALEHPEQYRVRAALTTSVLRAIHRRLVEQPESIDFEVLEGEHEEQSVLVVRLADEVHAYSSVPAIASTGAARSSFVAHPQVSAFLREQNAHFLFEQTPWLRERGVDIHALVGRIEALGAVQLDATLGHLAPHLPRRELAFHGREPSIP